MWQLTSPVAVGRYAMHRVTHANGVITYTFELLAGLPLRAHVSTRHGGISPQPWNTLNFSVRRGDAPERVAENRRRFTDAVSADGEAVVACEQVHGTGVAKVDKTDAGGVRRACDALITDTLQLPLMLVFADCVPILLYDTHHHALGICHAGWRGTLNGAAAAVLWAMMAAYDTQPECVIACIGPSIGPGSYEVDDDVLALARSKLGDVDGLFTYPNGAARRPYFDLWETNRRQLAAAGVLLEQIEVSGVDTASRTEDFFSHRAERGRCGLFGLMAWLTEP